MDSVGWLAIAFLFWAFYFTWQMSKIECDVYQIKKTAEAIRLTTRWWQPATEHPKPLTDTGKPPADVLAALAVVHGMAQHMHDSLRPENDFSSGFRASAVEEKALSTVEAFFGPWVEKYPNTGQSR